MTELNDVEMKELKSEWEERRKAKFNQTLITLANLAVWVRSKKEGSDTSNVITTYGGTR